MRLSCFLQHMQIVARPMIIEKFGLPSCIPTVKILQEALQYFGVSSRPLVVGLNVLNKIHHEAILNGHSNPTDVPGAWSVGIGFPANGETFPMHLVIWLPDYRILMDPSLDQASRPKKQILLEPAVFQFSLNHTERFLSGESAHCLVRDDGLVLRYVVFPRVKNYVASPMWGKRDNGIRKKIIGQTIRLMKEYLIEIGEQAEPICDRLENRQNTADIPVGD